MAVEKQTGGFIKLHRSIEKHWVNGSAEMLGRWVRLLMNVAYDDHKKLWSGNLIEIKRGEFVTTIRQLSKLLGCSTNTTLRFLKLLESDSMITTLRGTQYTRITICNYSRYQDKPTVEETQSRTPKERSGERPVERSVERSVEHSNKKDKKEKKEKKDKNIYTFAHAASETEFRFQKLPIPEKITTKGRPGEIVAWLASDQESDPKVWLSQDEILALIKFGIAPKAVQFWIDMLAGEIRGGNRKYQNYSYHFQCFKKWHQMNLADGKVFARVNGQVGYFKKWVVEQAVKGLGTF